MMSTVRAASERHLDASWLLACLLLAWPAVAKANTGIGYHMVALPYVVMALVPAILVEAPVLARLLGVDWKRGLWWSFVANLYSTLFGSILAVVADIALVGATGSSGWRQGTGTFLASLVPLFFITWLLEARAVRVRLPAESTRSAWHATLAANGLSYALIAIAVPQLNDLEFPVYGVRTNMVEVLAILSSEKSEVEDFHRKEGRFPEPRTREMAHGFTKYVARDSGGRLTAEIRYPKVRELNGARIVMRPTVSSGKFAWECFAPVASFKYLPASCRQEEPGIPVTRSGEGGK